MALRAVPDHPKFADLKARLGTGKGVTLGYLESVWHFCGRFTPQGNIGKYTDAAIEAWVEWHGKPGELIAALVESRWIDRCARHRLVVHDWHEHADQATKLSLKRAKLDFVRAVSPRCPDSVRTESEEPLTPYGLPEPEPEPEPEPVPESGAEAEPPQAAPRVLPPSDASDSTPKPPISRKTVNCDDWADRLYKHHVKRKGRPLVEGAVLRIVQRCQRAGVDPEKKLTEIDACLIAWNQTPEWREKNGHYAPQLAAWLDDQAYEIWPNAPPETPTTGRKSAFMAALEKVTGAGA